MAENGWKQVFDNTYLHNFLFYSQACSMGQQVVFNYPMVSPKENTLLMVPYSFPSSHYSNLFVRKDVRKLLKAGCWRYFPQYTSMFYGPESGIQLSYAITKGAYYTHDLK
jgi:hypothetical protein